MSFTPGQAIIRRAGTYRHDVIGQDDVTGLPAALADKADQTDLESEETARGTGDATNATAIAAEATARAAADALKAPLDSPAFLNNPTAPTQAPGSNNTRLANTAFVKAATDAAIALLLGNAPPAALDTIKELADAINDDASFAASVVTALSGKQPLDPTLTTIAALVGAANKGVYFDGADQAALYDLSPFGRTLAALADGPAGRTAFGLGALAVLATVGAAQIDARAVTYAKIQAMATARLLGRATAGSGDIEELTLGANLSLTSGALSAGAALAIQGITTGNYHTGTIAGLSTTTWANGDLRLYAFPFSKPVTIDQVAFEVVTTAGGAGSVHRVVIYADNGAGYPGALVADLGTVATTTTGTKTISTSQTLGPGIYWLGVVQQGAPTPAATLRYGAANNPHNPMLGGTVAALPSAMGSWKLSVTGAAPNPFTAGATPDTSAPRVLVRGA